MRKYIFVFVLLAMFAVPAMAQTNTISVDTGTFIQEINNWLPTAISIMAIAVGIAGGFALARYIGNIIINAFNGRM